MTFEVLSSVIYKRRKNSSFVDLNIDCMFSEIFIYVFTYFLIMVKIT